MLCSEPTTRVGREILEMTDSLVRENTNLYKWCKAWTDCAKRSRKELILREAIKIFVCVVFTLLKDLLTKISDSAVLHTFV